MATLVSVSSVLDGFACAAVAPERLPLEEAAGCVLAESLVVPNDVPAEPRALRSGWAVESSLLVGAAPYAPALLRERPSFLDVGEPLPERADAIVPIDALQHEGREATGETYPGDGVRAPGSDCRGGHVIREAGQVLRPLDVAVGRLAGLDTAIVRRPRVALVGADPVLGLLLAEGCRNAGAHVRCLDALPDDRSSDLTLVVAGNERERSALTNRFDEASSSGGLALRPGGEGMLAGTVRGRPLIAVPPRLEAAFAALVILVRPCLEALAAFRGPLATTEAILTRKLASRIGLAEVALVRRLENGMAEPLGLGDLTLTALSTADGWLVIPPESEGHPGGGVVVLRPMSVAG